MTRLLAAVILAATLLNTASAATFDHTHAAFTRILKSHVSQNLVDYTKLKRNPGELNTYLKNLSTISEMEFRQWNRNQQIALLLNLYNAHTLRLIIDNYPLSSIKKIGWLPGAAWRKKFITLFDETVSLGHIEHELLRKKYNVPEIHFALVCAAKGCPPLRTEAYRPDRLIRQLAEQGRVFLADKTKNRVDPANRTIHLSPIFKWFDEDFEKKSGSVSIFIQDYLPASAAKEIRTGFSIEYTDYDWSLNDQTD